MEKIYKILIQLVQSELCGVLSDDFDRNIISEETLIRLYKLSKKHDMAHLIGSALKKNGLLPKEGVAAKKFSDQIFLSIYRYENLNYEYTRICTLFEESGITFVPLKGSVIRKYYPQPWMRTSCDIDILIKREDLDRACDLLRDKFEYDRRYWTEFHDVSLFSKTNVHLELHFNILENIKTIDPLLSKVWDHCIPIEEKNFEMIQSPEYFVFHHLAHMSYHFVNGGCGMRPFVDLYLIDKYMPHDKKRMRKLLKEGSMEKYYDGCMALVNVWFNGAKHTRLTKDLEEFVLTGGIYGNLENSVSINRERKGGKIKYLFFRTFPPFSRMVIPYPFLKKHKWLLPICYIRRIFRFLSGGKAHKSIEEIKTLNDIDENTSKSMSHMVRELGL